MEHLGSCAIEGCSSEAVAFVGEDGIETCERCAEELMAVWPDPWHHLSPIPERTEVAPRR